MEYADDGYFDFTAKMTSKESVIDFLEELVKQGYEIEEVFFFDHSNNSYNKKTGTWTIVDGLYFGDDYIDNDDEYKKFCNDIVTKVGSGVTYHFRNCFLGMEENQGLLKNLAEWLEGSATGVNGWILPKEMKRTSSTTFEAIEKPGPDYYPNVAILGNDTRSNYSIATYDPNTKTTTWGVFNDKNKPEDWVGAWY